MHQNNRAKNNGWLMGYLLLLAVHLLAILSDWELIRFISKPLLMTWLLVYFISVTPKEFPNRKLVIISLVFSWLGDVFLLQSAPHYFLAGLGSFLFAQLVYSWIFIRIRKRKNQTGQWNIPLLIGIGIYIVLLYGWLFRYLPVEMKLPVLIYALAIGTMFQLAFHCTSVPRSYFSSLLIAGAALFVVSDSLLAVNQFIQPFPLAGVGIMLTYGLAQLFIIHSIFRIA
jgi:uncharacterized membrane protein YhhN